ncbi:MAG: ABC transporter substrate-binding protein [Arachidicoccus sp.]|nr:ABC transporter substrate-binding protein [Arachidicoccus sp.]
MNLFIKNITIISTIIFFVACKNETKNKEQIFYYNESRGILTLDPAFAKSQSVMWPIHQIYNRLIELDSNLNLTPSLAKKWNVSADFLTYTFHLRSDVFFRTMKFLKTVKAAASQAQDVAYSLNRLIDPSTASSGAWLFNNRIAKNGFIALDDSTFQLKLIRPFHPILNILTTEYCSIVPQEIVEKYGKDFGGILASACLLDLNFGKTGKHWFYKKTNITGRKMQQENRYLIWMQ